MSDMPEPPNSPEQRDEVLEAQADDQEQEQPTCAKCGKPIGEGDLTCPHCGVSLVAG